MKLNLHQWQRLDHGLGDFKLLDLGQRAKRVIKQCAVSLTRELFPVVVLSSSLDPAMFNTYLSQDHKPPPTTRQKSSRSGMQ